MRRMLVRTGALALLIAVLAVPLWVVWWVVGARPPSTGQLLDAWREGLLEAPTAIGLGAVVFTGVWVWLALIALAETMRAGSGRRPATIPARRSPAALVRALARLAVTAGATSLPVGSSVLAATAAPAELPVAAATVGDSVPASGNAATREHVASGRDTAYSVALDVLGDPDRRDQIVALNAGRCGPDGRAWSSGAFPAGMAVLLPADDDAVSPDHDVVVQPGDSWWSLAEEHLGDGHRWRELQGANVGIRQPSGDVVHAGSTTIHPGWTLRVDAPAPLEAVEAVEAVASATTGTHVVQPGETLSGIVEEHYTPDAAEEHALVGQLFAANAGVTDPRGRPLVDPNLIHPGMVLTLPPQESPPTVPAAPSSRDAGSTPAAPAPAESPTAAPASSNAPPREVPVPSVSTAPPDAPTPAAVPSASAASGRPSIPPSRRTTASGSASAAPTDADGAPARSVRAPEVAGDGSIDSRENDGETPPWVAGSGVAGASLVATGLGAIAVSRRRRRLRASRAGDRPAPIDPGAEAAEAFVRTASDSVAAARLDLALRALAARLNGAGARPQFVVRADDGTIEVHLDRPRALDAPWVAVGEGSTCWALPPRVPVQQLVAEAGGIAPPCPALVTVGRDARGEVLVDVEAVGGLHVDAPAELADPLLRSVALELAVTPLAEVVHVVTVGVELGAIDVPERLHVVHDLGSAVERAGSLAGPTPAPGESMGAFVLRVQAGHESWEPVVLVLGSSAGDLPPLDSGVAVVGPAQPNGWRLVPDGEEWLLDPVGLRLHPAGMSEAVVHSAAILLDVAGAPLVPAPPSVAGELAPTAEPASAEPVSADPAVPADPAAAVERAAAEPSADPAVPADVAAAAEPADAVEIELEDTAADHHEATAVVAAADDNARPDAVTNAGGAAIHVGAQVGRSASPVAAAGEYQLLVRVLGPVDVIDRNGEPVHFDRPKALELVVWLAQHRSRASRTAARTALWDVDVSNATFSNVVSAARRALARLVPPPHGEEWLARTYAEALPLHPRVALDVDLVEDALAASRHMDDDAAADTLTGALDLIRGAPYTGVHYLWPDAEALPSQLTLLATSIAQELGRRRLAQGDVDGVLAATAKGLAVLPGHEELVCLRMRALATSGDRSAVRREFAGYERAVLADPWSGGELADPVVATRNELLGAH